MQNKIRDPNLNRDSTYISSKFKIPINKQNQFDMMSLYLHNTVISDDLIFQDIKTSKNDTDNDYYRKVSCVVRRQCFLILKVT